MTSLVLLIEDDASIREVVQMALEYEGVDVQVAEDGEVALQWLETSTPDLILLDLLMPRMNGKDFLMALRNHSNPALVNIPVVVTSATEAHGSVLSEWIQGVLSKPLRLDDLIMTVRKYVSNRNSKMF